MLISQIFNIGNLYYDKMEEIDVMLGLQNAVRPSGKDKNAYLLVMRIDASNLPNIKYDFEIIEYDKKNERNYLLGLTSGSGSNYSLTLSTGWKYEENLSEKKKQDKKEKFFDKIIKIKKNSALDDFFKNDGPWVENILGYIEKHSTEIYDAFENNFIQQHRNDFPYPLICKIKVDETGYKYLGEFPQMIELYKIQFFPKIIPDGKDKLYCRICGSSQNLTEAFKLGMYSTTHDSFVMTFFEKYKDLSGQNIMCTTCFLKTLYGFNIIQDKLNYYAYRLKAGRGSDSVNHFIIPITDDDQFLDNAIKTIERAKRNTDTERSNSIQFQITNLSNEIQRLNRKLNQSEKAEIKEIKENIKKYEQKKKDYEDKLQIQNNRIDMEILLNTISESKKNLSILDIYYIITNVKQNPKTIEIVSEILYTSENINLLANIFKKTKKRFGKVKLQELKYLVEDNFFLEYYSSLLSLRPQIRSLFNKRSIERIKRLFLNDYANFGYRDVVSDNQNIKYYNLLDIYDRFDFMFDNAKIWR